jgi:multidrug efflux pump subunit AcrB
MKKQIAYDFIIGGSLVSVSLLVAELLSPVLGGLMAALPVRLGITLGLLAFREDDRGFHRIARGCLAGMTGSLAFTFCLYITLLSLGILLGFALSLSLCAAVIISASVALRFISRE